MGQPYVREVQVTGLIEKLGRVQFADDLEDLFKWRGTGTGVDWVVEKSTTVAFTGNASLHVKTKATTPAPGDNVFAAFDMGLPYSKQLSAELVWKVVKNADTDAVYFRFTLYDGTTAKYAILRWLPPEGKWQYYAPDATYKDVPGGEQRLFENRFHRLKMKVDFEKNRYINLRSDDKMFDLSDLSFYVTASTVDTTMNFIVGVVNETTNRAEGYFDEVVCLEE